MTRLKLVTGKTFPGSSDHGEAAEPRRGAGGSAVRPELLPRLLQTWLCTIWPQDWTRHQQRVGLHVLNGGTLMPSPLQGSAPQ